ncbi:hypothetical protein H4Q26_009089 [Puccinia striiformis f. sp. tritici PST-130]|nr:hypothetical protein H4Q26_009089 [Puccinia striiformis f. sp. tritici PST-130]
MSTSYPADIDFRLVQVSYKTKVSKCVSISLSLLEVSLRAENDQRPLCLHTLPPPGTTVEDIERTITTSKQNPDKNAVGRLISIVEIIKRDFAGNGSNRSSKRQKRTDLNDSAPLCSSDQLHQYNQYGSLESLILERSLSSDLSERTEATSTISHALAEDLSWPTKIKSLTNVLNVFHQQPSIPRAPTSDIPTLSALSALGSTLVNPKEDILDEESNLAPV